MRANQGKEMEEEIICNRWKDLDGRNKEKKGKPSSQREKTNGSTVHNLLPANMSLGKAGDHMLFLQVKS